MTAKQNLGNALFGIFFIDRDTSFARGFECGIYFERMNSREEIIEDILCVNKTQFEIMCKKQNYKCEFANIDSTHTKFIGTPNQN